MTITFSDLSVELSGVLYVRQECPKNFAKYRIVSTCKQILICNTHCYWGGFMPASIQNLHINTLFHACTYKCQMSSACKLNLYLIWISHISLLPLEFLETKKIGIITCKKFDKLLHLYSEQDKIALKCF